MTTPLDLFLESITGALTRIRALLFVNLGLCAIVLSNAYLENFSFDDELVKHSYVFREVFEQKKNNLTAQLVKLDPAKDTAEREAAPQYQRIEGPHRANR